jgi:hypothetical protein
MGGERRARNSLNMDDCKSNKKLLLFKRGFIIYRAKPFSKNCLLVSNYFFLPLPPIAALLN